MMADKQPTPAEIEAALRAANQAELKRQQSLDKLAKEVKAAVEEERKP